MLTRAELTPLFENLSLVFQLTGLPIQVAEIAGDSYLKRLFSVPDFPEMTKLRLPLRIEARILAEPTNAMPMVYNDGDDTVFSCIPFRFADDADPGGIAESGGSAQRCTTLCVVMIGPCFLQNVYRGDDVRPRGKRLTKDGCFRGCTAGEAATVSGIVPYREPRYVHAAVRLAYRLVFGKSIDFADLLMCGAGVDAFRDIPARTGEDLFERRESDRFHMPYSVERELWDLVRQGAVDKIRFRLETQTTWGFGIIAKNTLRHEKNMLVASTTLATRAAIDGGVPDEIAYALSDSVIRSGEELVDVEGVLLLNNRMVVNFAELVLRYKNGSGYSREISLCLDYVNKHLFDDVSLDILSDMVNLSTSQISRKFRKETGKSIVGYVQAERVREAETMLRFSPRSIPEIGNCLNFGSQSYFTAVFRKHTGMTPAEFRRVSRER